ncbi:serine hydrolase domain-containing protein [Embleya sp. NPDC050154]|uniref:serine hydrolase domain-containing protein n=1 Tax=Embleya sp. NPDC050154 TaxID=3363988 RepID=UPI0037874D9D
MPRISRVRRRRFAFLAGASAAALMLAGCSGANDHDKGPSGLPTASTSGAAGAPTATAQATAAGTATAPATAAPPTSARATAVAAYLDKHWPSGAGGAIATARNGELVSCQGRGRANIEARVDAGCDTVFDIGSITKSFTAAAILKLETTGALRVTEPIGTYLGPVPADKRGITVHHLLTHTSGLPEGLGDDYDPVSRDDMLARALAAPLDSAPGKTFGYSNVGYSLLAAILEKASGTSYSEFLTRNLFTPAGMTRTGYRLADPRRDDIAVEYDADGHAHGIPLDHPWAPDGPYWNLRGNGGLLSTARDMYRWYRALDGESILPAAAKAKMFSPHVPEGPDTPQSYGYGWSVLPSASGPIATHDGGNDWSYARFLIRPADRTMVFWVSNHVAREGKWNLEEQDRELSLDLLALTATTT